MIKHATILLFSIALLAFSACDGLLSDEVQIRLKNTSLFDFEDIIVNTSGSAHDFEDLLSSETSQYQTFEYAYRYAFIELQIQGETYTIQPIDFVGETKLTPGHYTYALDASPTGGQYDRLSLTLIED